ncbi:MAG: Maf family nucleotide pyrophosphatase, partial [Bacteroidia bacterium]
MIQNPASFDHLDVILASGSPRRQMLLKELGLKFTVLIREVEESFPSDHDHRQVAEYLAVKKSDAYKDLLVENKVIITADTLVFLKNKILNKPSDFDEAVQMLKSLSGNSHEVVTGVCIASANRQKVFHVVTKVFFRELMDEEVVYFVDQFQPYDKAGAYGAQDW